MIRMVTRRSALQIGAGAAATLSFPSLRAHEFYSSNLTVFHPWTRASSTGATSAIVSMKFDDVRGTDSLIGAQSRIFEGSEFGGEGVTDSSRKGYEFVIREGESAELSELGTFLRVLGLKSPLQMGREYPMTLMFAKSGPLKAALLIDFPALD
jgi:copper(I)-binding protein